MKVRSKSFEYIWSKEELSNSPASNDYIRAVCDKTFEAKHVNYDIKNGESYYIVDRSIFDGWDHINTKYCEIILKANLDRLLNEDW